MVWLSLGNGQMEKRARMLQPPVTKFGRSQVALYESRGIGHSFDGRPHFVDHAICHSSLPCECPMPQQGFSFSAFRCAFTVLPIVCFSAFRSLTRSQGAGASG